MRPRAIKDLAQLSDTALFEQVATGLGLIITNARRLYESARALSEGKHFHGAHVLEALSKEEASKYLILVDAIRCPRAPGKNFTEQLGRFNSHLVKGLYAEAYWMRPATLEQLQDYLQHYREDFYLDGPNDVDWIFRNDILRRREEALYVDYVAHGEDHTWSDPGYAMDFYNPTDTGSLLIAGLLHDVGMSTPNALAVVAEIWRTVAILPRTHWSEIRKLNIRTLECLNSKGLLQERPDSDYEDIVNRWQFPLCTLELSPLEVHIESLREKQRLWTPDW